jgi:hypothetical protein
VRPALHPVTSPNSPGSGGLWRSRFERDARRVGEEHPASQAALGRWHGHTQAVVPAFNATGPAAVAWFRVTGARAGYMNRHERRARRRLAQSKKNLTDLDQGITLAA